MSRIPIFSIRRKFRVLPALLVIIALAGPVYAQNASKALVLDASRDELPLAGHLEILEDPTGRLSLGDMSSPRHAQRFVSYPTSVLKLDKPWVTYWLRLNLSNGRPGPQAVTYEDKWMLELGWPFLAMVMLYTPQSGGGWQVVQSGVAEPVDPHVPKLKFPVFTLDVDGLENATVYLQIKTFEGPPVPIKLVKAKQATRVAKMRMLLLGLSFGVLLAMILYNLSMYIFLRQSSFLWYVLSGVFLGLHYVGLNGLAYEFAPEAIGPVFHHRPTLVWLAISVLCLLFFAKRFLGTKSNSPFGDKILNVTLVIWSVVPVLICTFPTEYIDPMMSLLGSLFVVGVFLAGMLCWRQGFKPARFFLLAWCFSAVGGVAFSLTMAGAIPYSPLGFYAMQVGTSLEMLLLSLALADRVRILRRERDAYEKSQRRFRDLSIKDGLTGAFNKRYLLRELPLLVQKAIQEKQELSVAVLDLDDFKEYNDTHGHLEGDKVLVAFAKVMADCLRQDDLGCRFGGEEFVLILPGSDRAGAQQVAERIRTRLSQHKFELASGKTARITTSIGLASLRIGDTYRSLLERADQAVYRAKSAGKNQTFLEPDP